VLSSFAPLACPDAAPYPVSDAEEPS